MKVICVDGGRRPEDIGNEPLLKEGEVYHVEGEVYGNTSRGKIVECYKLTCIELPHVYVKNRFVLCSSDGDGTEEYNTGEMEIKKPKRNKVELSN